MRREKDILEKLTSLEMDIPEEKLMRREKDILEKLTSLEMGIPEERFCLLYTSRCV